jgi:hypothetical protein
MLHQEKSGSPVLKPRLIYEPANGSSEFNENQTTVGSNPDRVKVFRSCSTTNQNFICMYMYALLHISCHFLGKYLINATN